MFGSKTATFDRALEKATSQLLLEPDWDSVLQICDSIRQGDIQPKAAVAAIKRKVSTDNPHVALYSLQVLESCMKNCGSMVHGEVASKEFMEFMKDQAKLRPDPVKAKILELIQIWSHAFRNEPSYKVVQDTFHLMKMEGYKFPTFMESDAMFSADKAPEWADGDVCTRCRVAFGMVQRKHHCRNCGDVYCAKCSSKTSILPKFGIEREVRVCDACYDKLNASAAKKESETDLPAEYLASPLSKQNQVNPPTKTEQEIQEEEELQLALALSISENESKSKNRPNYSGTSSKNASYTTEPVNVPTIDTSDMDPELARYLNRNYWVQRSEGNVSTTTPSAPVATTDPKTSTVKIQEHHLAMPYQNGEADDDQVQFLNALQSSIEIFVNRMRSNSQRGRSIANDSSVQSLFTVISNMHPQLLKYIQEQEDLRGHYESLQDKLAQLRDAREALDALREEHREKRRREMEELERQRQIQMAQKLEIMRQKKHEYLEMQRQLALQRLQEQEREMHLRLEQQKQLTQMRQMQTYGYPQAMAGMPQVYGTQPGMMPQGMPPQGMPPGPPHMQQQVHGYSPAGSAEGSPIHQAGYGPNPPGPGVGTQAGGHAAPNQPMYIQSSTQGYNQLGVGYPIHPSMSGSATNIGSAPNVQTGPTGMPGYQSMVTDGAVAPPPVSYPAQPNMQYSDQGQTSMPPQQMVQQGGMVPGQSYSVQPGMEYPSFNMQNMAGTLPQQNQPVYSNSQQQFVGTSGPSPQPPAQYIPQPQQMQAPTQQQQQQQQQMQAPTQQQQQPPPSAQQQSSSKEAELISFD
ncbi:hepatocyte growth factor-regulated tyrosine kinase substrate-like isoform X3 [Gigantopelta aegis]|uniref:hepatocyte growth factor-regulated tyrosine kinase substrate-like isoform X3 n=1 Tax=Gigantopelta aegis TaxID=1735272 RepID=UPI001B88CB94|nr:hepatocyte growth factor-regulated tyrosine kinase substrate-like isoform X3 [Gigantopelta aegis]